VIACQSAWSVRRVLTYAFLDLELGNNKPSLDTVQCDFKLEFANSSHVDVDLDPGCLLIPRLFNDGCNLSVSTGHLSGEETYITKNSLLDTTLDNSSSMLTSRIDQFSRNDRRRNSLGSIDNLLDTGYTKGDVHRCDTGEMESFQRHLGTGFTDRLGTDGSYG